MLASPAAGLKAGCLVVPLSEQAARKKEQVWKESKFCLVGTESEALSSQSGWDFKQEAGKVVKRNSKVGNGDLGASLIKEVE